MIHVGTWSVACLRVAAADRRVGIGCYLDPCIAIEEGREEQCVSRQYVNLRLNE